MTEELGEPLSDDTVEDLGSPSAMLEWFGNMVPSVAMPVPSPADAGFETVEEWLGVDPANTTPRSSARFPTEESYGAEGSAAAVRRGMGGVPFGDRDPADVKPPALREARLHVVATDVPEVPGLKPIPTPALHATKARSAPLALVPALFIKHEPLRVVVAGNQGGSGRTSLALDLASVIARLGQLGGVGVALWEATASAALPALLRLLPVEQAPDRRTVTVHRAPASWGRFTVVPAAAAPDIDWTLEEAVSLDSYLTFRHHVVIAEVPGHPRSLSDHIARRTAHLLRGAHAIVIPVVALPGAAEAVESCLADVAVLGGNTDSVWLWVRGKVPVGRTRGRGPDWHNLAPHVVHVPDRRDSVIEALTRGWPPTVLDEPLQDTVASLFAELLEHYRMPKRFGPSSPQAALPAAHE